jgi:dTDP-4-amino-4,6-dideoxygalactose transaminase
VRRLRNGGQATRYDHVEAGVNSRLDELQAAVLRARLPFLRGWTVRRRTLASLYRARLAGAPVVVPPEFDPGHVYHLFPVRSSERPALQAHLASQGFDTLIHYPVPIPRLPALASVSPGDCPVASQLCDEVLSLPLYPSLTDDDVTAAADAVCRFASRRGAGVGH